MAVALTKHPTMLFITSDNYTQRTHWRMREKREREGSGQAEQIFIACTSFSREYTNDTSRKIMLVRRTFRLNSFLNTLCRAVSHCTWDSTQNRQQDFFAPIPRGHVRTMPRVVRRCDVRTDTSLWMPVPYKWHISHQSIENGVVTDRTNDRNSWY